MKRKLNWDTSKDRWKLLIFVSGLVLSGLLISACSGGAPGLQVGDQAPEFQLASSDGDQVSLSDYSGQPVLLYFHMALG